MTDGWDEVMDPESTGHLAATGERMLNLCATNRLKVGGSLFCHENKRAHVDLAHSITTFTSGPALSQAAGAHQCFVNCRCTA